MIAKDIFIALNFMHKKSLAHIVLKPQNIFISDPEKLEIKLSDFGFATFIDSQSKGSI